VVKKIVEKTPSVEEQAKKSLKRLADASFELAETRKKAFTEMTVAILGVADKYKLSPVDTLLGAVMARQYLESFLLDEGLTNAEASCLDVAAEDVLSDSGISLRDDDDDDEASDED
jgi:hypothetical protein